MIFKAIETVTTIMLLIGVGLLMSYLEWYRPEHKDFLTNLIINVSVPAVAIRTFFKTFPRELLLSSGNLLFIVFITIIIVYIVAYIISRILKLGPARKASFLSMSTMSNLMFIGLPVCTSVFGDESAAYIMIYYIVATVLLWAVFAPKFKVREEGAEEGFIAGIKNILSNMLSIPLATLFFCIIFSLLGVELPNLILSTTDYLADMSTPLSLIFIGGVIYEVGIKNIKLERDSFIIILLRFILAPVVTFIIGKYAGLEDLPLQVFTVISGMPPMTQLGVIASAAESEDYKFVMTNISSMTVLSLFFIPIYFALMPMFL